MKKACVYSLFVILTGFMIVTLILAIVKAPENPYLSSQSNWKQIGTSIVVSNVVGFVGTVFMATVIIGLNLFYFLYERKKSYVGIVLRVSSILLFALRIYFIYDSYITHVGVHSADWVYFTLFVQYAARIIFIICIIERLRKLPGYFSFSGLSDKE